LWHWLGQLPDPRDPRGVRFSLPCVIAIAMAARLAGCDSFTAAGEWSASRPQRVLKALGCPRHKRARVYVAPSEKTIRRVSGLADHDLADAEAQQERRKHPLQMVGVRDAEGCADVGQRRRIMSIASGLSADVQQIPVEEQEPS